MNEKKAPSTLVVGFALFSMFFGSGNLIFPLMLGAKYQAYFYVCVAGFVITAVLLPTLGIMAMIPARGRFEKLFDGLVKPEMARWFFLLVLIFWIPLGSGPRCVLLAHASISTYFIYTPPILIFSLLFLILVYICVLNRGRLIDILGKVLTPLLLISISAMVISSFSGGYMGQSSYQPFDIFIASLVDGYYTQDLIAAIFFSSALVTMLHQSMSNTRQIMKKTWRGGLLAVAMLAIIYGALMASSAIHGEYLQGLSGDRLVAAMAHIALGSTLGGISSLAVSLACFTTEIALVVVMADFLSAKFLGLRYGKYAIGLTLSVIWMLSLLDFAGLMTIIAPAMQVIYPVLFFLVLRLLWRTRSQIRSHQ